MRFFLTIVLLLPMLSQAANTKQQISISCISDLSSLQGRHKKLVAGKSSERAKSRFSEWMMAENFGDMKSKIKLLWKPHTGKGPSVSITTNDKSHNSVKIRSYTKSSAIVVSSASNPFSIESWSFVLNFKVETLIATRVQSNIAGVKGEVITYNCQFDSLDPDYSNVTESVS